MFPFSACLQGGKWSRAFASCISFALITSVCINIHVRRVYSPRWNGNTAHNKCLRWLVERYLRSADDAGPRWSFGLRDVNGLHRSTPAETRQTPGKAGVANRCCGEGKDEDWSKQINRSDTSRFFICFPTLVIGERAKWVTLLLIWRFTDVRGYRLAETGHFMDTWARSSPNSPPLLDIKGCISRLNLKWAAADRHKVYILLWAHTQQEHNCNWGTTNQMNAPIYHPKTHILAHFLTDRTECTVTLFSQRKRKWLYFFKLWCYAHYCTDLTPPLWRFREMWTLPKHCTSGKSLLPLFVFTSSFNVNQTVYRGLKPRVCHRCSSSSLNFLLFFAKTFAACG